MELLAQVVEELSILASDHRYKKPRQVPRPHAITKSLSGEKVLTEQGYWIDATAAQAGWAVLEASRIGADS